MSGGYDIQDHTADLRLRVWGSDFRETLTWACLGMWSLITDAETVPREMTWEVEVTGSDPEELLVNFLNEQLVLLEADGLVAGGVEFLDVEERGDRYKVKAVFSGCRIDKLSKPLGRQIKAATYHRLEVAPTGASITFDV